MSYVQKRITSTQNHEIVNSSPYISPPFRLIIEIDSICSRISFQKQVKFHCVHWPTAKLGLVTQYAVDHRVAQSRELNTVVCSLPKIHAVQVFWVSKPRKLRFSDMERCLRLKYTRQTTWNRKTSDYASGSKQLNGFKSCLNNNVHVSKLTYFWLTLWFKDSNLRYCSDSNRNNSILWDSKGIRVDFEATSSPKCCHVLLVCQQLLCVGYLFQFQIRMVLKLDSEIKVFKIMLRSWVDILFGLVKRKLTTFSRYKGKPTVNAVFRFLQLPVFS